MIKYLTRDGYVNFTAKQVSFIKDVTQVDNELEALERFSIACINNFLDCEETINNIIGKDR